MPAHFESEEEAGNFWDTHSAADYWDEMEEVEMEFDIKTRTFLIPLDERIYKLARDRAKAEHCTVEQIVNTMLAHDLAQ